MNEQKIDNKGIFNIPMKKMDSLVKEMDGAKLVHVINTDDTDLGVIVWKGENKLIFYTTNDFFSDDRYLMLKAKDIDNITYEEAMIEVLKREIQLINEYWYDFKRRVEEGEYD